MKVLILGASGRTGKLILDKSLRQGYIINCLLRDPEKVKVNHHNLSVFKG